MATTTTAPDASPGSTGDFERRFREALARQQLIYEELDHKRQERIDLDIRRERRLATILSVLSVMTSLVTIAVGLLAIVR